MSSPNIERIVENIRKATKGMLHTDEKLLIDTIVNISPADQEALDGYYKATFGKSVIEVIESETSGDFGKLLAQLCLPETHAAAIQLHKAMEGVGCNEEVMIETLIGRSNFEVQQIKQAYLQRFGKHLEQRVQSETSGHLKKAFVVLLQGQRDEQGASQDVQADVQAFYKAGEGKIGTDETEFIHLLFHRSEAHLLRVFQAYAAKHGRSMDKVIKKEFSGDLEKMLCAQVKYMENKGEYFADLLEKSMAGIGTNEKMLSRLVVRLRGTHLMQLTKEAYLKKHGKTLEKRVNGECSGNYLKLLIALIEQPIRVSGPQQYHQAPPPQQQPGYPPQQQPGYPPQQQPGYPPQQQPGYPPQQQQGYPAYPPPQQGYPAYPGQPQPQGYPPQPQSGYPSQTFQQWAQTHPQGPGFQQYPPQQYPPQTQPQYPPYPGHPQPYQQNPHQAYQQGYPPHQPPRH